MWFRFYYENGLIKDKEFKSREEMLVSQEYRESSCSKQILEMEQHE